MNKEKKKKKKKQSLGHPKQAAFKFSQVMPFHVGSLPQAGSGKEAKPSYCGCEAQCQGRNRFHIR
jgi:hypothetical protein